MKQILFLIPWFILFTTQTTFSQIPRTRNYQGILTDANGSPLPDGDYTLTFRIYDVETGGAALWTEEHAVLLARGLFNVILGEITPITLPFDKPYWLTLQVGDEPEMSTRVPFTSVPYSFNSVKADTAQTVIGPAGGDLAGNFPNPIVTGIQGNPVSATPAEDGQVLKWNAADGQWQPATDTTATNWQQNGDDIFHETGNVGIGTDQPTARLHIVGSSGSAVMALQDSGGATINGFVDMNTRGSVDNFIRMTDANGIRIAEIDGDGNVVTEGALDLDVGIAATGTISTSGPADFASIFITSDYPSFISPRAPVRMYRNSLPIAYGSVPPGVSVGAEIDLDTNYGVHSVIWEGGGQYEITLKNAVSGIPVVIVNAVDPTSSLLTDDRIATFAPVSADNKLIRINIADGSGTAQNTAFSFVIFGTPE